MQIQVHTDTNIEGGDRLLGYVETEINAALSRFSDRLTRVEVHLGDENANKSGEDGWRWAAGASDLTGAGW